MAISVTSTPRLLLYGRCKAPPTPSSMAALRSYCLSSTTTIVQRRKSSRRMMIRASMDACSSSESKKIPTSVSFTGKVNKIYEDKNMGILCYTDENGELVCEGLDEGPRLTWQDMEKMNMEKKTKNQEEQRQRTLPFPGGIDWSSLQAAVSMGKN
ncbi:hypothetical protein HU200_021860 [Digitaria exilis]|uniref:Uncharacterized protein n=1 Tax=Digitaria exilis TaxID=1010633 RepID=A0A835EYZ7_9POAL|nr:hypothetical protein HU200_021860 [Digitaria exilis]